MLGSKLAGQFGLVFPGAICGNAPYVIPLSSYPQAIFKSRRIIADF